MNSYSTAWQMFYIVFTHVSNTTEKKFLHDKPQLYDISNIFFELYCIINFPEKNILQLRLNV